MDLIKHLFLSRRRAYRRLRQEVDESKFCAGGVGGEGVCYGDSGGKKTL